MMRPIDHYVTEVRITSPLNLTFPTTPKDLEILAGTYTITVSALGKESSASITLSPGQVQNVDIIIPGTAGIPVPLPTLFLLLVIGVIASVGVAIALRRRPRDGRRALDCKALVVAAQSGDVSVAMSLLEGGCNPNIRSANGLTALHVAAQAGNVEAARLLLDAGADPNARDAAGRTPLHMAADRGRVEVAKLLLERGADRNIRDSRGRRPVDVAVEKGHTQLAELLNTAVVELEDLDETKTYN